MEKRGWRLGQFTNLIRDFMNKIWEEYRNQLPEDTVDELIFYLGDPATMENVIETLIICLGELSTTSIYYNKHNKKYENPLEAIERGVFYLNEEELFTLMIELCAVHIYEWDFKMKEILALLFSIRYNPESHKKDIMIWKELVNVTL